MDIDVLNPLVKIFPNVNEKHSSQQIVLTSIAMLALAHGN
jgi:hypothetical protein